MHRHAQRQALQTSYHQSVILRLYVTERHKVSVSVLEWQIKEFVSHILRRCTTSGTKCQQDVPANPLHYKWRHPWLFLLCWCYTRHNRVLMWPYMIICDRVLSFFSLTSLLKRFPERTRAWGTVERLPDPLKPDFSFESQITPSHPTSQSVSTKV